LVDVGSLVEGKGRRRREGFLIANKHEVSIPLGLGLKNLSDVPRLSL